MKKHFTRREMLKLSGGTVGGMIPGSPFAGFGSSSPTPAQTDSCEKNTYFGALPVFPLGEPLDPDEMRITFLGTSCIPRLSQECNSVFVETGTGTTGKPDPFVFDLETGAADRLKGACPAGWHMPADEEWKDLEKGLGMSQPLRHPCLVPEHEFQ
jgi:hypothetical protein